MRKEYGRDKKIWTKREIKYVAKYMNQKTAQEIAAALHRPPNGVEYKIQELRRAGLEG